jgi:hypothetical protein
MKTSLQKILDWIKAHRAHVIYILLILIAIGWISLREVKIVRQTRKMDKLTFENATIARDRIFLEQELKKLKLDSEKIKSSNDSMKVVLAWYRRQLSDMERKHKKEIDSLLNIPDDTVYVRLQPIYPNFDTSPLLYPFSGSQIRQIYTTAISFPMLSQEHILQGKTLKTCLNLNTGYEKGISNLNSQIANLESNIKKCDEQVGNYKSQVVILQKQVGRQKFWQRISFTTAGIAVLFAVLK